MASLLRFQRGASAVEMALLVFPLALMAMVAVEYARAIWTYNAIAKATREGVRLLTYKHTVTNADADAAITRVVAMMNDSAVPGLTSSMVQVCHKGDSSACTGQFSSLQVYQPGGAPAGVVDLVRVQVSGYTFQPMVPLVSKLTSVTFEPIGTTMRAGR
ncbi:MAG: pilus assembly protein [Burkholderiales bacterium]|nr:MAG: pilus assembly protein [Burkholderiales bacterium]